MSKQMRDWLHQFVHEPSFVSKYRYYASVLARLDPVEDPHVEVMAVSARGFDFYLHVNIDFFVQQPQLLKGVLLHEVHHVVLGHLGNPKFRDAEHRDLMELAMEISANEYISEPLPGNPPVWQHYRSLGIGSGQSTLERYHLLVKARQERREIVLCPFVDSHLPAGVGAVRPGAPAPDPGTYTRVRRLVREAVEEAKKEAPPGGGPGGRLAGKDPGHFLEELEPGEAPLESYMDWKAALQMFVALVRTPIHTWHRPNRRFPHRVGEVPGRVYYPGQARPPALLVALDTSGSMTTGELNEIARQLVPLNKLVSFTVVECDSVIHRVYPFEGRLAEVAGRGGTDFRPVFAPEFLAEHSPDGVIYFTDGEGPWPPEDPGVRTLWVLSKPQQFGCPWGQKAHMPRPAQAS
jgi:predicted metal-dependent peptidase